MTTEWRSIKLAPVQKEVSDLWKQAVSLVSVDMGTQGTPRPSPTAIAEKIALIVIQNYEEQANPDQVRQAKAGIMRCWYPLPSDVEFTVPDTGKNLTICGSFSHLEQHHSVPRSLGGADSELVWLCASHHRAISDGVSGRDWRWLRQALGYE